MVFISYSSKDYNIANQIRGLLQKENIHCWMAPESIPIGSDYATEIPLAINNCDYFILVLSKNSQQSIYVPKELDIAISQKKMVFPLNIDASLLEPNFRLLLTNIQSIDASMKFEEVIQYVANRIRNRIEATENSDFAFNEAERQSNVRSESPYNLNKGHLNIGNYDGKHLRKNDNIDSARKKSIFGEMNIRKAFVFSIIALGLSFPAVWIYILKYDFNLFLRIIYFCGLLFITYLFHDKVETNPQIAASCFGTISVRDINLTVEVLNSRIISVFGKKMFYGMQNTILFKNLYTWKRMEFGTWDNQRVNYLRIEFISPFKDIFEWYDPSVFYLHALSIGSQSIRMLTRQGFLLKTNPNWLNLNIDYLEMGEIHVFLFHEHNRLKQVAILNCSKTDFDKKGKMVYEEMVKRNMV